MSKKPTGDSGISVSATFVVAWIPAVQSKNSEINMKHLSQAVKVSNRKRFRLIEKIDLVDWAIDNPTMDEAKDIAAWATFNEEQWCKLITAKVSQIKQEMIQTKTNQPADVAKVDVKKPFVKRQDTIDITAAGYDGTESFRRRIKLREQLPTGYSAEKGDEPEDGPELYIILKGFDFDGILSYLIDKAKFKIDCIMVISDFPSFYDDHGVQKSTLALYQPTAQAHVLIEPLKKMKWYADSTSLWQQTAWLEFSGKGAKHHLALFDKVCNQLYKLLELRKNHSAICTTNIINLPKASNAAGISTGNAFISASNIGNNNIYAYFAQIMESVFPETKANATENAIGSQPEELEAHESLASLRLSKAKRNNATQLMHRSDIRKYCRLFDQKEVFIKPSLLHKKLKSLLQPLADVSTVSHPEYNLSLNDIHHAISQGFGIAKEDVELNRWLSLGDELVFSQILKENKSFYKNVAVIPHRHCLLIRFYNPENVALSPRSSQYDKESSFSDRESSIEEENKTVLTGQTFEEHYIRTKTHFGPFHDLKLFIDAMKVVPPVYKKYDKPNSGSTFVTDIEHEVNQQRRDVRWLYTSDGGHVVIQRSFDMNGKYKTGDHAIHFYQDHVVAKVQGTANPRLVVTTKEGAVVNVSAQPKKMNLMVSMQNGLVYKFLPNGRCLVSSKGKLFLIDAQKGTFSKQGSDEAYVMHPHGKYTTCRPNGTGTHVQAEGHLYDHRGTSASEFAHVKSFISTFQTNVAHGSKTISREDGVQMLIEEPLKAASVMYKEGLTLRSAEGAKSVSVKGMGIFEYRNHVFTADLENGMRIKIEKMADLAEFSISHPWYELSFISLQKCVLKSKLTYGQVCYELNLTAKTTIMNDGPNVHSIDGQGGIKTAMNDANLAKSSLSEPKNEKLLAKKALASHTGLDSLSISNMYNPSAYFILFPNGSGMKLVNCFEIQLQNQLYNASSICNRQLHCNEEDLFLARNILEKNGRIVSYDPYFWMKDENTKLELVIGQFLNHNLFGEDALAATFDKPIDFNMVSDEEHNIFSSFTLGKYRTPMKKTHHDGIQSGFKWKPFINEPIPLYFDSPEGKANFTAEQFKSTVSIRHPSTKSPVKFKHIMSPDDNIDLPDAATLEKLMERANAISNVKAKKNLTGTIDKWTRKKNGC